MFLDVDVHVVSEWHDYGPDWASFFREGLDSDSARNLSARFSCIRITALSETTSRFQVLRITEFLIPALSIQQRRRGISLALLAAGWQEWGWQDAYIPSATDAKTNTHQSLYWSTFNPIA